MHKASLVTPSLLLVVATTLAEDPCQPSILRVGQLSEATTITAVETIPDFSRFGFSLSTTPPSTILATREQSNWDPGFEGGDAIQYELFQPKERSIVPPAATEQPFCPECLVPEYSSGLTANKQSSILTPPKAAGTISLLSGACETYEAQIALLQDARRVDNLLIRALRTKVEELEKQLKESN